MCPEDDLEVDDLDNQAPNDELAFGNDLIGFYHHTCFETRSKSVEFGVSKPRFSKLKSGVRPIFR
jgi:hypothetical protein